MTLRQNDWTLGIYCQTYCRVVTMHHSIEDQAMYPRLRAADPTLGPALDRMVEEHHAVHGRLEELDSALVVLVTDPAAGVDRRPPRPSWRWRSRSWSTWPTRRSSSSSRSTGSAPGSGQAIRLRTDRSSAAWRRRRIAS